MSDEKLERALRALGPDPVDEAGYYKDAFASFKGEGAGLRILVWVAILACSALLLVCLFKMMRAPSVDQMVIYGVWTILAMQAQIALKLWFNMQLNRRAVTREIRRLGLLLERR
jgi:hypothetical protein